MDFEEMSDMWEQTKPDVNRKASELRDGVYDVRVVGFEFKTIPGTGLSYKWWLEVCDGLCSGSMIDKFQVASKVGMKILATDFMLVIGRKPTFAEIYNKQTDSVGTIEEELVGKTLRIRQTTKGKYKNYYFNELLGSADSGGNTQKPVSNGASKQSGDDYMIPEDDFGEEVPF